VQAHVNADQKTSWAASDETLPRFDRRRVIGAATSRGAKVGISMLWYSAVTLSRGLMKLVGRSPRPRFVVLYYHEVPERARGSFARQMQALSRKATVVRAAHAGTLPDAGSYVAITFDDAFQSVRRNAVPELISRGFPATIFVAVDTLGEQPGWEMEREVHDQVMTCDQLRSLPALIELGSHSLSHPRLPRIDSARLRDEVTRSRDELSDLIGQQVSLLAFPYGEYDDRVVGTCRQAGYERVFGIDPWPADPAGRDFVRGRVAVDPHDGPLVFHLKAQGAYSWMIYASAAKRSLARWRRSQ
jgi:peptidoglycan/xylan/chitin deacetylase (PgdA/CDA1 family)